MFKEYKYGAWRSQIRELTVERLKLKNRIRYHQNKISHHKSQIKDIENIKLQEIENNINKYLKMAGNDIE